MPSREFAIRIYGERLTVGQREAMGVYGCLALYLAARADAKTHTVYLNLEEFAVWTGCSYSAARQAWDRAEADGLVSEVRRRAHGFIASLGEMFQRADVDATLAVRVYEKVHMRRPHSTEREAISTTVGQDTGDLKLWRQVCETWKGNAADTTAMLESFERRRKGSRVLGAEVTRSGGAEAPGLRD